MERPAQWVRGWKPEFPGIHEVFHARFVERAYPSHTHEAWTVFTDRSRTTSNGAHRGVVGAKVTLLPPHVVHEGRPAAIDGYRKRVLYVSTEMLGERMIGPAVDRPDVLDPSLVRGFRSLHRTLADPGDVFEAESTFALVAARLSKHLGGPRENLHPDATPGADDFRYLLDARLFVGITLAEAGRILEGQPLAQVAADVGFHDPAHFTKHSKRHVGTTPGSYRGGGHRCGS
jgi:AraC-like DNA-binding protein